MRGGGVAFHRWSFAAGGARRRSAGALVATGFLGLAFLAPSLAQGACTPATGSNVTVTCAGVTFDQGPETNTGYGSGLQNGLTLNVQSAASVTGTSIGIDVRNNNTINNLGVITTFGSGGVGDVWGVNGVANLTVNNSGTIGRVDIPDNIVDLAGVNANDTGLSVVNNAGGVIQGASAISGVGVGTVVNSGLINGIVGGGGQGIFFDANNTSTVTVTNNASGTITGDAFGIDANAAVVTNYGVISAPEAGSGGTGLSANTLTLVNYASGVITGDGFGVTGSQTPNLTIANFGTISATGLGGLGISGDIVNVTNSGTIAALDGIAISTGTGSVVNKLGGVIEGNAGIAAFGNMTIVNAGAIIAGDGGFAIVSNDNNSITSSGSITSGVDGFGISVGDNNVIKNSGSITSGFLGTGIIVGDNNSITNLGTITSGEDGAGIDAGSGNTIVTSGKIVVGDGGTGIQAFGGNNVILNSGAITGGGTSLGIGALGSNNAITNNGTITVGDNLGSAAEAIVIGQNGTATNNGAIVAGIGSIGIVGSFSTTIVNNGTITVGSGGLDYSAGIDVTGGGFGSNNIVVNNGKIIVGDGGVGINTGEANTITNNGAIVVGANGISIGTCGCVDSIGNVVVNNGTLDGRLNLLGTGNSFTNSGLIEITNSGTPVGADHIIDGTFTQLGAGVLALRVNAPGAADFLSFGADTLAVTLGGTLKAVVQPGLYGPTTTYLGVVTATDPIVTTFNTVASSSPFFNAVATYNPTTVDLTLSRVAFGAVSGETQNEQAVGNAIEPFYSTGLSGNAAVFFSNLLAATSVTSLDQISGEGTSGTQETAFGAGDSFLSMMMDQGSFWRSGDAIDTTGAVIGSTTLNYAADEAQAAALNAMAIKPPPEWAPRWRAWTTGFDGTWSLSGQSEPGSASLTHRTAAGAFGLDYQVDRDLLLGVAAGASGSSFSVPDRMTSGTADGAHLGAYGVFRQGPSWYASGSLAFSAFDNHTSRTILGVGPAENATGSFNSNMLSGRFEVGYKQAWGAYSITPFAALQFSELWEAGYGETSTTAGGAPGILGLTYAPKTVSSLPSFLGAQLDTQIAMPNGVVWSPYLRASWVHEFEPTRDITATFISLPGASFTVDGANAASDALRISVGSKFGIAPNASLFVSLDGQFSDRGNMYAGKGGVKITW